MAANTLYAKANGLQGTRSLLGARGQSPPAREAGGLNPADRGKKGSKRHLLVEEHGVPLSLVVTGANRHDVTQWEAVLDALVIERPKVTKKKPQHLCAGNSYTGQAAPLAMLNRIYTHQFRPRAEETRKEEGSGFPGRGDGSWKPVILGSTALQKKMNPRCEKTLANHTVLLHLAAAIRCWRKIGIIYG